MLSITNTWEDLDPDYRASGLVHRTWVVTLGVLLKGPLISSSGHR